MRLDPGVAEGMGPIEIAASGVSQAVNFRTDVANCSKTTLFGSRTYPPLAHHAASVRGTRPHGQGVDKSAQQDLVLSVWKTKLLIGVNERNS